MTIKCPYSSFELKLSLASIAEETANKLNEEVAEKINSTAKDPTASNIAEYHGIPVEALLASPNYKVLLDQYIAHAVQVTIDVLTSIGLTDKQAWAILLTGTGEI